MRLIDVTIPLHEGMIVYPGDPPFRLEQNFHEETSMLLSCISMNLHTGTHVDVPRHFIPSGESLEDIPLTKYYGPCVVLDLSSVPLGNGIRPEDLGAEFRLGDIVLFKTQNSLIPLNEFREDYVYLDPDAARHLVKAQVKTVGIDYLSIDKMGSTDSHVILFSAKIPIFERVWLRDVEPGRYFFVGGPLPIVGAEGGPARAILIASLDEDTMARPRG